MTIDDNLAAHALGCFYENFSTVQSFCRFCNITLTDFKAKRFWDFSLRTKSSYDEQAKLVENDETLVSLYGVKGDACLNELHYYLVIEGLPPDPAHDLFEGFEVEFITN